MQSPCPACHLVMQPEWYFCPHCGKQMNEPPLTISIPKQLFIYLVSFFFSPFGLGWALKYIRHSDRAVRIVGTISLILTLLSLGLTLFYIYHAMQSYSMLLKEFGGGRY